MIGTYSLNLIVISLFIIPGIIILKNQKRRYGFNFTIIFANFIFSYGILQKEFLSKLERKFLYN